MQLKRFAAFVVFALAAAVPAFAADLYTVDKSHSDVSFRVKHLMASVAGRFHDFNGTITVDPANVKASSVEFTINVASINTAHEGRDKHLLGSDFFDAEKFPTITFKSTAIAPAKEKDVYNVTGDFTMRGVTKRITIPVTVLGFGKGAGGDDRAGFELTTKINRKDFGLNWNRAIEAGGFVLGEDVSITVALETVKKKPAA